MTLFTKGLSSMVLTPLEVTAGGGVLAFAAALATLWQKILSDRHTAWWVRAQWAIDRSLSEDEATRLVGFIAMSVLARDRKAKTADLEVLVPAIERYLERYPELP